LLNIGVKKLSIYQGKFFPLLTNTSLWRCTESDVVVTSAFLSAAVQLLQPAGHQLLGLPLFSASAGTKPGSAQRSTSCLLFRLYCRHSYSYQNSQNLKYTQTIKEDFFYFKSQKYLLHE
jgi:hypothetical protein